MVLYATGFNAWNQLQFEGPEVDEPDDIASFTCVLREDTVDHVRAFSSYTRVTLKNGSCREAGWVPEDHEKLRAANDRIYASFVQASHGVVVVYDGNHSLHQYDFIWDLLSHDRPAHTFSHLPNITQLVAYATGFAALSSTGRVWTWGDDRYEACLGREATDDSPGNIPSPVTDLDDLPTGPITKLAAGGYILAALTAGNDLYCWGQAGRSPGSVTLDDNLTDAPSPVLIDDDKDVLDVAVGETHMIVLTADRAVYVLGDNANGQLGLPGVSVAKTWTCVDLDAVLGKGEIVTGVAAGPKSSFLIVHKQPEKCQ